MTHRRAATPVAALVGALLFQVAFALFGALFPDAGGLFGAPLAAGKSTALLGGLVSLGGSTEWWPIPFAIDAAVVAAALWGAGRIGGIAAIVAALFDSVVAFLPVPVAFLSWHNVNDPWTPAGFPFAAASDPLGPADRLTLLGNSVVGAAGGLAVWLTLATRFPALRRRWRD